MKIFIFILVYFSGISYACANNNTSESEKLISERNTPFSFLRLNEFFADNAWDKKKSTKKSARQSSGSLSLMISDAKKYTTTDKKNNVVNKTNSSEKFLAKTNEKNKKQSLDVINLPEESSSENEGEKKEEIKTVFKEMVVTEEAQKDSHYTSPSTRIRRAQIETQNAQTTEEVLKFQPSLQIRQRYVGDPNGVLGIRGADMFSTARNMVFADGLPIHNHLQGTFNGAPRWSLVGPNEIDVVDVVYGPFSAEYSSNSIGGVVNLKTRMPRKREFYMESSLFIQDYKDYGPDKGTFIGNRQYISAGDRFFDKVSVFAAYNRLEAQSHPMTYLIDNTGLTGGGGGTPVTGGIFDTSSRGVPSVIYGDTGPEKVTTDLMKFKLGYDITPALQAIFTAAYENRVRSQNNPRNYLTNTSTGQPFFGGGVLPNATTPGGTNFDVQGSGFRVSEDVRQTLQLGLTLRGALTENWFIDTTTSHFNILKDERARSNQNPFDPLSTNTGRLQAFPRFSWFNHDIKISTPALFGYKKIGFLGGYHFDEYKLKFRQYTLSDYANMTRGALQANRNNKGQTTTHAFFGQTAFRFLPDWDLTTGIRQEFWSATNGVVGGTRVPDRHLSPTTPKVSIGYEPNRWKFRYSWARTHRFPVISELYQSLNTPTSITLSNALLKPENGMHHNFMIEYGIPKGYVRVNVFRDDIKNAINRVRTVSGILTTNATQNIGTTSTTGVEFIYDQKRILRSKFDFMLNFTWMKTRIEKGPIVSFLGNNVNLTGKQIIRLPNYRLNFFTTYHATNVWDISLGGRYTSDSFNDLDNGDVGKQHVFGAQSDFFFLDFKTNYRYQFDSGIKSRWSFGITNLNDFKAYVFHPYPQRTFLLEAAFSY